MTADTDPFLAPYRAVADRIASLAQSAPESLDERVPACPAWRARDVVAHLTGLAEDWAAGRLDDYGSDAWARAQVDRFDGATIDEVLAAWSSALGDFAGLGPSSMGGTAAMWAFGDGIVHEADLRPVLAPGTRPPADAVGLGLKGAIARWRGLLGEAGVPPLEVIASDMRSWRLGEAENDAATVETDGHELFRALYGRRSRAQVESWNWSVDPAPYLDLGLPYPFRWSEGALQD